MSGFLGFCFGKILGFLDGGIRIIDNGSSVNNIYSTSAPFL